MAKSWFLSVPQNTPQHTLANPHSPFGSCGEPSFASKAGDVALCTLYQSAQKNTKVHKSYFVTLAHF